MSQNKTPDRDDDNGLAPDHKTSLRILFILCWGQSAHEEWSGVECGVSQSGKRVFKDSDHAA